MFLFSSLHKKEEDPIAKVPRKSPEETDSTKAAVRTTMAEAIIKQSCLFSSQYPFKSAQQISIRKLHARKKFSKGVKMSRESSVTPGDHSDSQVRLFLSELALLLTSR